jgi:hypothetical protein
MAEQSDRRPPEDSRTSDPQSGGATRKPFLVRLPPDLLTELRRWAEADLRSLNSHIEYLLREAVRRRGRGA